MYTERPADLIGLAQEMKLHQPEPLCAGALHPNKEEAIAGYISRFKHD